MTDTTNTAMGGNTTPAQGDNRTFSQDDVNRIVGERLAKEKTKADADFVKKEQELAQREIRISARELLSEKGLPVQLMDALNCTSKETLEKSISLIEEAFKQKHTEVSKLKIKGASPGNASDIDSDSGDNAIRKAMGLLK